MAEKHFLEQEKHTESYLIPYLKEHIPNFQKMKILEVGCAEAGFVKYLHNMGCDITGLELEESRVEIAQKYAPETKVLVGDITNPEVINKLESTFDLIVMRDVIEHIEDRDAVFSNLNKLLNENGYVYITFPPRFSAFAGHQQNGKTILRNIPFLQLLPDRIIKTCGKILNENKKIIQHIITNYKIGLSIQSFENYCKKYGFNFIIKELFLLRPVFKVRFGLPTIKFPDIPFLREVKAMGCECLLQKSSGR